MVMKRIIKVGVAVYRRRYRGAVVVKRAMPKTLVPSFPVTDGGVTPSSARGSRTLAEAERVTKADVAIDFARASAVNVEPLLHGTAYFPRMLADIAAAEIVRPSPHVRLQARRDRRDVPRGPDGEGRGGRGRPARGGRDRERSALRVQGAVRAARRGAASRSS